MISSRSGPVNKAIMVVSLTSRMKEGAREARKVAVVMLRHDS